MLNPQNTKSTSSNKIEIIDSDDSDNELESNSQLDEDLQDEFAELSNSKDAVKNAIRNAQKELNLNNSLNNTKIINKSP